jgi:hypothetical protein
MQIHRLGDDLAGYARRGQGACDGPDAGLLDPEGVIGQLLCEGAIVHESHAFEPREDALDLVELEASLQEAPLQLPSATGSNRQ